MRRTDNKALKKAIAFREKGQYIESEKLLKEHIKRYPSNIEAYAHLVLTLSLMGKADEAWRVLIKAEHISIQNSLLLANRARLLLKDKKVEEAFSAIKIAFEKDKNSAFIQLIVANIFKAKGDLDKAQEFIDNAIKIDPKQAEAYAFRGLIFYEKGNFIEALSDIKQALILKPHLLELLNLLSIIRYKTGDIRGAIEAIEQLLKYIPQKRQKTHYLIKLAEYRVAVSDIESAIEAFEAVLEIEPNRVDIYKRVAILLNQNADNSDKVIEYYKKALTIEPNEFEILNNIAVKYVAKDEIKLAIENYNKALAINPTAIKVYDNLAILLIKEKRFDKAFEILEKALSIEPNSFDIYMQLGQYFREIDNLEQSIAHYQKAISLNQKSPMGYYKIGITYMIKGDLDNAVSYFHNSLELSLKELNQQNRFDVYKTKNIDTQNAEISLQKLHKAFTKREIPFFLSFGTLLGVIREGGILPHDKDMDIGLDWDLPRELIEEIFIDAGFKIVTHKEEDEWIITGEDRELGISIDAFFHKKKENKIVAGFDGKPYPIMWAFPKFELVEHEWIGYKWLIPDDYEVYFESCYGKGWRVPDKAFDTVLSAYNLAPESRELSICFGLNRLIKNITKNNYQKAIGYCQQLIPIHDYPIIHKTMKSMEFLLEALNRQLST